MKFDDITEQNFILYAMKFYDNAQCLSEQDFYNDLKIIKYIKRLLNRYKKTGELKTRLMLNHIIMLGNVFPVEVLTRILFLKIPEEYWRELKTFFYRFYWAFGIWHHNSPTKVFRSKPNNIF